MPTGTHAWLASEHVGSFGSPYCTLPLYFARLGQARSIVPQDIGPATETAGGRLLQTPSVTADPIVTGFDGQVFDFHATGDYSLLATEEWKVGHSLGSKSARRPAYIHLRL